MTAKRETWAWDGHGGLLVDGQKVAQLEPGSGDVGRRLLAVPDYEAALLTMLDLHQPNWRERSSAWASCAVCAPATAALRKGGVL